MASFWIKCSSKIVDLVCS
ncbi:hypothetical protein KSF78_0004544 [Schistosoma japonicum]|nr:hypothetical protein KSF78_0004544 [Schistosoma japonicum]